MSAGEHAGLNLAQHVGDDERAVARNRELLDAELGVPVVFVDQTHSTDVHVLPAAGPAPVVSADALVTDRGDVALAIMVADCLPVLLSDPVSGTIAAAHAGRAGLLAGVLERTIEAMTQLGARPADLTASIGPSICGACYEVPEPMRAEAGAATSHHVGGDLLGHPGPRPACRRDRDPRRSGHPALRSRDRPSLHPRG